MSQFFLGVTAGNLPPSVAESFLTQDGTAVPLAHQLIINGFDSSEDNQNGITTKGGVVGTGTSNEVDVVLTNRITGTATTTDAATTQTLYSFPLGATPGTYILEVQVIGYNITDELSAGYNSTRVIRTDGATAVLISANPGIIAEETDGATNMDDVLVANGISGNNATLTANGILDKTIHWLALTNYIFVS